MKEENVNLVRENAKLKEEVSSRSPHRYYKSKHIFYLLTYQNRRYIFMFFDSHKIFYTTYQTKYTNVSEKG